VASDSLVINKIQVEKIVARYLVDKNGNKTESVSEIILKNNRGLN
jgi:hypothetical protein